MLYKLLCNINRSKFIPSVITLTNLQGYNSAITELNIKTYNIGLSKNPLSFYKIVYLIKILHKISPFIVHTWMYHSDLLGGLIAHIIGVPKVIWCVRHSDFSRNTVKISTYLVMRLCSFISNKIPHKIIYCSKNSADIHQKFGYNKTKTIIIPNGFDLSSFCPSTESRLSLRNELRISSNTFLIGQVGRFHPQKNHLGFLKAASLISNNFPQIHFLLVGKNVSSENKLLIDFIEKNNLFPVVHLMGLRHDISNVMSALDILVSPSTHGEAFPNVIGEAMSCGVPCVVTDVGDSAEIVGNTGFVVKSSDTSDLVSEIIKLINLSKSERSQLSVKARMRVQSKYNISNIVKLYESVYLSQSNNNIYFS